jgi:hypothetical protein
MKPILWRVVLGVFLLLIGVVALLQTLRIVNFNMGFWPIFFSAMFVLVGLAFLAALIQDRTNWWAAIPGVTLLSIGALIGLNELAPGFARYGGSLVLGGIGLSFWLVYLLAPQNWWAIIPGGTMLSLAVVAGADAMHLRALDSGGFLFLGLAVTFALLGILPTGGRKMNWPWIPAAVLLVLGVLISFSSAGFANFVWPVILILVGIFFLTRNMFSKSQ